MEIALREDSKLYWRYTRRYLFAMGLVACAIMLGAFNVNQVLELNRREGDVMMVASTQHSLAQRLILIPDRIASENNPYSEGRIISRAREAVHEMRAGHYFLMNGDGAIAPPISASKQLLELYTSDVLGLDRDVTRFLDSYERFLDDPDANWAAINLERVNAENFLLISLTRAVELHSVATEERLAGAIDLHRFWVAVALALSAFVVACVFRPLARSAASAVAAMSTELDEGSNLLSRSFEIAKMGHWRVMRHREDAVWLSAEIIELLDLDVDEGFYPLSVLQLDEAHFGGKAKKCSIKSVFETGEQTVARSQFSKPNGDIIDLLIYMDAEFDVSGEVVGVVGVVKDDTAEAEADRALKASYEVIERKSRNLMEAQLLGNLGTWRQSVGSSSMECDHSAYQLLGIDPKVSVITADSVAGFCVDDAYKRLIKLKEKVIETRVPQSDTIQVLRGDGVVRDLHVRFKLETNEQGKSVAVFGTLQDVSKERAAARELEKLAYFDNLTGLANRTLFTRELDRISNACARGNQKAALLLIDLDHFKEVNDTLGHQAGDELLGIIGHRLTKIFKDVGFVARLGGDEFAVVVENTVSKKEIDTLCNAIIESVNLSASLSLGVVQTNASIGVALAPLHSSEPTELLSFADLALYSSKEQGRGRACYYVERFSKSLETRISLGSEMRSALDESRFEAHYQPIVDIKSQMVCGFEALLRLPKGDGGFIPPSQFIPVAESSHLIADLGSFVLHRACSEAQSWIDADHPRRTVSVNVSAAQIWHGDLEQVVDSALSASRLDPTLLCLELTESVFVADNFERLNGILCRLKERGIKLALDDFGTGYSSLGYLNRLPFDILKIDRMFVSNAHTSVEKRNMLSGVIGLAKGLDLKVTAEGVELKEEMKLVRELGCDAIQGWYYSKALPGPRAVVNGRRIDAQRAIVNLFDGEPHAGYLRDPS